MRVLVFVISAALTASAAVRLPAVFSDGMVLQRNTPARVWGWSDPGEAVTIEFRGRSVATQADEIGRWSAFLHATAAGGPFELTVRGTNQIRIANVLVGEVWVASGQSNMEWSVEQSRDAATEIAAATYPQIRFFRVEHAVSQVPLLDVKGSWSEATPQSAGRFSAVGYFFARHLHKKLGVPVAILQTAWGGTPADSWVSGPSLAGDPALLSVFADWAQTMENHPAANLRYEQQLKKWEATKEGRRPAAPAGPNHQHMPSGLYNAMIAPLTPYSIQGAIWYQGESNAGKARSYVYRRLFTTLIEDWRRQWGQGDFPFLWVQLANFKTPPVAQWPELREAQTMALGLRNTGQAVTIDIGESNDIHPKNKQDVGDRLALAARAVAYGEALTYSGPVYRQAVPEGTSLRLHFNHVGGGLIAKGGELKGFTIAGADGKFVPADASIDGATVVVSSPAVAKPASARYAWADDPVCNLYNREGLPASPFRTDDWAEPRRGR